MDIFLAANSRLFRDFLETMRCSNITTKNAIIAENNIKVIVVSYEIYSNICSEALQNDGLILRSLCFSDVNINY